jgi:hypothetical protein
VDEPVVQSDNATEPYHKVEVWSIYDHPEKFEPAAVAAAAAKAEAESGAG